MNGHGTVRFTRRRGGPAAALPPRGRFPLRRRQLRDGRDLPPRDRAGSSPIGQLVDVPFDHPIYHAFYDLPNGPPKIHEHDGKPSEGLGIFDGDRLVVFYTYQSDIGDGIEDPEVHKDPPEKREEAMKMAINIVVYALTR